MSAFVLAARASGAGVCEESAVTYKNHKFETHVALSGGTLIYGLYRYVPRNRVWCLRFPILK